MVTMKPYLQLMRPANVVTAVSDVLAGIAISLLFVPEGATLDWSVLLALIIATIGLYGGGVVFNDVFDADLDARERPERPIPSGKVSVVGATRLAIALFLIGVVAAGILGGLPAVIASSIVVMCLFYDKWAKHHPIAG